LRAAHLSALESIARMEPGKRFGYYARLSSADKRVYRRSDAITSVPLPDAAALFPLVRALAAALEAGKRPGVGRAAGALCDAILRQLGVSAVRVRVREVRPKAEHGELHGLYTFAHEGKLPEIEVWMRTAEHRRTVKFPTFLRTLAHEIAHHLDMTLLGLDNSFHTVGFFRRESSLSRQLLAAVTPSPRPRREKEARPPRPPRPVQLSLFGDL
jgi:hypothetical protein